MKPKLFAIIAVVMMFGCQPASQTGEISVFDISKSYPKKELHLQSIADVEYVALETTDEVLLSGNPILSYVSDKYIVIYEIMQGDVYIFDRKGKIVSFFNHKGPGDKEYVYLITMIFDEKNEEIFIFGVDFYTDNIMLFGKTTLDFTALTNNSSLPSSNLLYEIKSGNIYDVKYVNDDFPSREIASVRNRLYQVPTLKTAYDEKQLKGDLEQLTAKLDDDDNPVLMILKYK